MTTESDAGIETDDEGRPVAYARGLQTFMDHELFVAPGALVPRKETELLAKVAIAELSQRGGAVRVIDMCCGAGNLACAIAAALPAARVWAADLTDGAVLVARKNVERLGLHERVTVWQGDLFVPLETLGLQGVVDAVVCNPPYISSNRLAARDDLAHEPREAFDGGPYGISIHQRVVSAALPLLRDGGTLLFEFGVGQERQVKFLFERSKGYEAAQLFPNEQGQPRVISARKRSQG
jgi:release factor glutamine methyltransferase